MDRLITDELQKYKLWIRLLSSEISPEGEGVYFVDIWKIIIQAVERSSTICFQAVDYLTGWKNRNVAKKLKVEGKVLLLFQLIKRWGLAA